MAAAASAAAAAATPAERWSAARANAWYAKQAWIVGANFVPADAINQLEMWQEATFDPAEIDRELGWAQDLGMNSMRVFLHDLLWQQDAAGFKRRIGQFLDIAARHGTTLPWDSWQRPYTLQAPLVWFHDLLHRDGTPYREREAEMLRELTGRSGAPPGAK